jgi:hypothetical protein
MGESMRKPVGIVIKNIIVSVLVAGCVFWFCGPVAADGQDNSGIGPGMMYGYGYNQTDINGYPGMMYGYGYNQTGVNGYPGMMYGYGWGSGGMMGWGLWIFCAVLGILVLIVWLVVGVLLILWLIRQLGRDKTAV